MVMLFISCKNEVNRVSENVLKKGIWKAELTVQDNKLLPFNFKLNEDESITIFNAEEKIIVNEVEIIGDSIIIQMPVYEGVLKGKIVSNEIIRGEFVKPSLQRTVPFILKHGDFQRFEVINESNADVEGSWEMVFSAHSKKDRYIAKGIFQQVAGKVIGTIRTTTGDYRYLEGVMDGKTMKLSTFDGAHAFLFEAEVRDNIMYGFFYSGNHWKEPFSAVKNENYELPSEESLTYLKEGYDKIEFSFPDTNGKMVSLNDERFENKVVVVQIMGTWCPNCLDETKYYTQFYNENKDKNIEFVSLAFEYAPTIEKANLAIKRLVDKVKVPYPVLLAQYGTSDKKKANEKLPMLNHVLSYPTSIFIDKKGKVRKIHTGFNGPATGEKYKEFQEEFKPFINQLLEE
ncbi:MAG: thiol-disulfide isomerase/thioredoxin [Flavobacteriaceae bacterium]|jgi:thiol-disulfide isomerase/thioredoxin